MAALQELPPVSPELLVGPAAGRGRGGGALEVQVPRLSELRLA
jgi:hypothetical protein